MVHRRSIDGTPIVLGNQGALWGNAMTWWDHETGSVWSQPLGEAILGPLTGTRLELLSSTLTTWDDWRAQHPSTLALDAPGGQSRFDAETLDTVAVVEHGDVPHHRAPLLCEDVEILSQSVQLLLNIIFACVDSLNIELVHALR